MKAETQHSAQSSLNKRSSLLAGRGRPDDSKVTVPMKRDDSRSVCTRPLALNSIHSIPVMPARLQFVLQLCLRLCGSDKALEHWGVG